LFRLPSIDDGRCGRADHESDLHLHLCDWWEAAG
jgi:hypothetical protein